MAADDQHSTSGDGRSYNQGSNKIAYMTEQAMLADDLWIDGLICAFELVKSPKKPTSHKSLPTIRTTSENDNSHGRKHANSVHADDNNAPDFYVNSEAGDVAAQLGSNKAADQLKENARFSRNLDYTWVPIGWSRISELVKMVQSDASCAWQQLEFLDEDDHTVADVAMPYWEHPAGATWWCHVMAGHPNIDAWLNGANWLHPAIRLALRDESRLISDRMKHLLYEVPVRVAGGLLFELLGQSAGDPFREEDDVPIVLRSWQAQYFLVTAMHVKGSAPNLNVLGITEVQELLLAGGTQAPRTIHEVIAHLASRLARWDDRLYRKYTFGEADEVELKFVNRRNHEDLNLLSIILNQEIKRLATQVIRVKWSLHARQEIVIELLRHLRGSTTRRILDNIITTTREMLEEQEAVRGRLFTIQDVMQSTVRAWLQDRSLHITHNLAVIGGGGLLLTIITGLFGINVDGIPGAKDTPYAFGLFTALLTLVGAVVIGVGMLYLGLQKPVSEEKVKVRKLELQHVISMFHHDAETHAKVREGVRQNGVLNGSTASDLADESYILLP